MEHRFESRLRKLERENRRFRTAAVAILGLAGATVLMGQKSDPPVPDEIRARAFTVVDEQGKDRATFSHWNEDGSTQLMILGKDGNARATLSYSEKADLAGLVVRDSKTLPRLTLGVATDGGTIGLNDTAGHPRVWLQVNNNIPELSLFDESARRRVYLVSTPSGETFNFFDATGATRVALSSAYDKNVESLWMGDGPNKRGIFLGVESGFPGIAMQEAVGPSVRNRVALGGSSRGYILQFANEEGRATWWAPQE